MAKDVDKALHRIIEQHGRRTPKEARPDPRPHPAWVVMEAAGMLPSGFWFVSAPGSWRMGTTGRGPLPRKRFKRSVDWVRLY